MRYVPINDTRPLGHISAAGITAPEKDFQNAEITRFLDLVTQGGKVMRCRSEFGL